MSVIGKQRRFLETAIASGLDYGMVSEDEVLAEITPEVLAEHMPTQLKAELLRACLEAERVDAELMVRTLGVGALAEHAPIHLLWRVVDAAGRRAAGIKGERAAALGTSAKVEAVAPAAADSTRKPNRRVRGAGATSRRLAGRETGLHRAGTESDSVEVGVPPSEIEVVEETEVGINAIDGSNGERK